jgi:mono/diheme cytochrome c family protein
MLGSGQEKLHHLFVWPAYFLSIMLVTARLLRRPRISPTWLRAYLAGMGTASALMLGAGYWGGEMLLNAEPQVSGAISVWAQNEPAAVIRGHDLFLLNCAHCHGDDARGTEEAPDLSKFNKSEARIASVVKNGIKGEMPRFDQKLTDADVQSLIRFIRSLNSRAA